MKVAMNVLGAFLAIGGLVWALQGAGILPGSVMSGNPFWLVVGTICLLIGAGLLVFANRKASAPPPK